MQPAAQIKFFSLLEKLQHGWQMVFSFTSNMSVHDFSGLVKAPLKRSRSTADGADDDSQEQIQEQLLDCGGPEEEQRTDNTSLLRLLEEGEKVRKGDTDI